jgi:hypothetical protein
MASGTFHLCKVQASLPSDKRRSTFQIFRDRFGDPTELNHRYTIYKEKQGRAFSIRVEDAIGEDSDAHVITTLGEYRRASEQLHWATKQHIIASSVRGSAHSFVKLLGYEPSHTWIEHGHQFVKDSITIKIFSILNAEARELNPAFFAVTIEKLAPSTPASQIDAASRAVEASFEDLLPGNTAFRPPIRP